MAAKNLIGSTGSGFRSEFRASEKTLRNWKLLFDDPPCMFYKKSQEVLSVLDYLT